MLAEKIHVQHAANFRLVPVGMVFKWLKEQGGLVEIEKRNKAKADLLYSTIDNSNFYRNEVADGNR